MFTQSTTTLGCASCAAYDAAAVNDWVSVTAAEYTKLALISNASKSALTDAIISQNTTMALASNITYSQDPSQVKVPASSYIYVMQFRSGGSSNQTISGCKVKVASVITGPYTTVGGAITTSASFNTYTYYYFAMKRPTYQTIASSQFAAFYTSCNISTIAGSLYYASGDVANPIYPYTNTPYFQLISTTVKQW